MRACRACGHEHETLMRCDVARRIREAQAPKVVANTEIANANLVANERGPRRGKYANPEKRRAYMRELMRRRRAEGKA